MGAHRCFNLNELGLQHDQYLHCHRLRCPGVWDRRANPRHSKLVLSMLLKSTLEISEWWMGHRFSISLVLLCKPILASISTDTCTYLHLSSRADVGSWCACLVFHDFWGMSYNYFFSACLLHIICPVKHARRLPHQYNTLHTSSPFWRHASTVPIPEVIFLQAWCWRIGGDIIVPVSRRV